MKRGPCSKSYLSTAPRFHWVDQNKNFHSQSDARVLSEENWRTVLFILTMGWFGSSKDHQKKSTGSHSRSQNSPATRQPPATPGGATSIAAHSYAPPPAVQLEQQQTVPSAAPELLERRDSDDERLIVVDRPPTQKTSRSGSSRVATPREVVREAPVGVSLDTEDPSKSFSRDLENDYVSDTYRQNHLNSLFNGHLMKWKYEAEEGSSFIRVPAFFGAIALVVTAVVALVLYPDAWTSHSIVMSVAVIIMAIFVMILDGRFLATNPLSARANLRNIMTRNFNIFRFVWGRGLLYIAAGVLSVAQMWIITICSGAFMIIMGIIAIIVGVHASRKFAALRNSLADESFLLLVFSNYDQDGDGYIQPNEFAHLLTDLGMELDDRYTLKAFGAIDTDSDRKISFEEFSHWWAAGYIERGRKRLDDDDDDEPYRRMM